MPFRLVLLAGIVFTNPVLADLQIDSFDDISGWNVWPANKILQGAAPGDPVNEGSGSLVADFTPYDNQDNFYINKTVSLDLSPGAIGVADAAISLWMWVGKDTLTARLQSIKFATATYNSEFEFVIQPWDKTWDIGWQQIIIPQAAFVESSTTTITPDWSNITWIGIHAGCYNDITPTDVVFDDLRLIETAPPPPPGPSDQIESFDNVVGLLNLSIWPDKGWVVQGTSGAGDPVTEGTGAMLIEYADNYAADPTGTFYINWNPASALDLSPATIGAEHAAISLWIWVGKDDIATARLHSIKLATTFYNSEFEYVIQPSNKIYDIGWNQVVIPQDDFINSSTTITDPDWANITWIQITATAYNDSAPTDVLFDDMRLVEHFPPPPPPPPGQIGQIDSFDDITGWNSTPPGVALQGTSGGGDPVKEGNGSLIADYTPYSTDAYTFAKSVSPPIDLAQAASIDALVNLSMWVGKTSETARIDTLAFETSAGNEYRYDFAAGGTTYPIGWNQLYVPMSDFVASGAPDWSAITQFEIGTTSHPDSSPTDVVFDNLRVIERPPVPVDGLIESFDDTSCMNVHPDKGWAEQEDQSYFEGTGALRMAYAANYAGDPTDDFQISWFTPQPLDLSPARINTDEASISFWMWVGKSTPTARATSLRMASDYAGHKFEYVIPASQENYAVGWNQVLIPQSDFTAVGNPDWSQISWIGFTTTSTPDANPTDVIIDNLRLVENKCNVHDLNGDCAYNLVDFALAAQCWHVDCTTNPEDICCTLGRNLTVSDLRCEYDETPLGMDVTQPRFSWVIADTKRGILQAGYQILVASSQANLDAGVGDMWDSGKVSSDASIHIPYSGQALQSKERYYWKARCWDQTGEVSDYSDSTWFEMGLLQPQDWTGDWIGGDPGVSSGTRKTENGDNLLRKEIALNKTVERAQVFISGIGYYELYINGSKVGDHVLDPAWTEFHFRTLYATYDVTELLQSGANALGVMLGNGYYSWYPYFYAPRMIFQMNIDFTDGTSMSVVSDSTWKTTTGPILTDEVYHGETYDARLEKTGWDSAGYNDSAWSAAQILSSPGVGAPGPVAGLTSQGIESLKVIETIPYERIFNGNVYDMGQNFAGWTRLTVQGNAGDTVVLRHAEDIYGDGTIDPATNGGAENTDTYILKGGGIEVYEPRFTYHGFRYVEVTTTGSPTIMNIEGRVVHNSVGTVGDFSCSKPILNKIHRNILWGMRSNLYGVLTDCPQRAERAGWMEVGHNLAESLIFNFDMARFYTKWMDDLKDDRGDTRFPIGSFANGTTATQVPYLGWASWPGDLAWTALPVIVPWHMYQQYGDKRILAEHYVGSKRFLDIIEEEAVNYLIIDNHNNPPNFALFSDWADPDAGSNYPTDADKESYRELHGTAFFYYCASTMVKQATVLGNSMDVAYYTALTDNIKNAFNSEFFDYGTNQYVTGSQYCNSMPLYLGIVPAGREANVAQNIANNLSAHGGHLSIGEVGMKYMIEALTDNGHADSVYTMVTKTSHPSWGHDANRQITVDGVTLDEFTTLVEFFNGGGSHNHIMWGTIDEWFYKALAGIDVNPDNPGYKDITIKPHVLGDLTWAQASVKTVRGMVVSDWTRGAGSLTLNVTVPGNSSANVQVPKVGLTNVSVTEGGAMIWQNSSFVAGVTGITAGSENSDYVMFDVGSGNYDFEISGD